MEAMRIAGEIEAMAGLRNDTVLIDALSGWAQVDPRAAFEWVAEDPLISEVAVLESLNPIFESLGREDFQEAMTLVDTLAQDDFKAAARIGVFQGLLASERSNLTDLAELYVSLVRERATYRNVMVSTLNDPRFLSFEDRLEFASYLREVSPGDADQFIGAAARLSAEDFPAETIAWADNLEDENLKRLALERAFGTWAQVDKESAEQWLFGTERSPTYDRAIRAYIFSFLYQDDPGAGFVFAEQISDGEFRVQAQRELWAAWRAMDRPAAQAFLQTDAGRFLMEEE